MTRTLPLIGLGLMAVAASADKPLRLRRGEGLKSQASNGSAADEDPSSAGAEILDYWRNLLEAEGGSLPTMPPVAPPTLSLRVYIQIKPHEKIEISVFLNGGVYMFTCLHPKKLEI